MAGLKKRGPAQRKPRKQRRPGPCDFPDKKKFTNRAEGERAMVSMQLKGKADLDIHVYPDHDHFHIGHDRRLTRLLVRLRRAA